ncbi:hypothetical protein ANCCAN_04124 [Ancylostoma caninum]|uniref:Uncharacterized protein n=1 Tax=Ancylostoma caninum TaxID=29170 RepID=A0A368H291_ANCCA|nr:hypothetical protein ANCCAN_04124 [Ancylostoma caninum]
MVEGGAKGVRERRLNTSRILTLYLLVSPMVIEELNALSCSEEADKKGKKVFACRVRIIISNSYSCKGRVEVLAIDEKYRTQQQKNGDQSFRCVSSIISAYQQTHSKQEIMKKVKKKATYPVSSMLMKPGAVSDMFGVPPSSAKSEALLSPSPVVVRRENGLTSQEGAEISRTSTVKPTRSSAENLQASNIFYNVVPTTTLAQEKKIGSTRKKTRKKTKTVTTNVPKRTKKKQPRKGKQVTQTSQGEEDFATDEFSMVLHFGVPIMLAVLLFTQLHLLYLLRWLKSNYVLIPRSEVEEEESDITDDHEVPKDAATSSSKERTDVARNGVGYSSAISALTGTSPNVP